MECVYNDTNSADERYPCRPFSPHGWKDVSDSSSGELRLAASMLLRPLFERGFTNNPFHVRVTKPLKMMLRFYANIPGRLSWLLRGRGIG